MNRQMSNAIGLGLVLLIGGMALVSDPKCKCGCRTFGEHLVKAGFNLLAGTVG